MYTRTTRIQDDLESPVRYYSKVFPVVLQSALGSWVYSASGTPYLDFFTAAGSMNYGHNNPVIKRALLRYLARNGILASLDCRTTARSAFLKSLYDHVLPRLEDNYHVHITAGTGADAVEAAIKLARKVTGRRTLFAFHNGYHGATLGALACTDHALVRQAAGVPLRHCVHLDFDNESQTEHDSIRTFQRQFLRQSNQIAHPAAIIIETVQAEGGVHVARPSWLRKVAALAKAAGTLLIIDDIQIGCGRTGSFFSFEDSRIRPDIILLGKSLSGFGLPLSMLLIRKNVDIWESGQHPGTFRGPNAAFVSAAAGISRFWSSTSTLTSRVRALAQFCQEALETIRESCPWIAFTVSGKGLLWGLHCGEGPVIAERLQRTAFEAGLLIERCGEEGSVLKVMPPLTISKKDLTHGLSILRNAAKSMAPKARYA